MLHASHPFLKLAPYARLPLQLEHRSGQLRAAVAEKDELEAELGQLKQQVAEAKETVAKAEAEAAKASLGC